MSQRQRHAEEPERTASTLGSSATRSAQPHAADATEARGSGSDLPHENAWTLRSALEHLNNVRYADEEDSEIMGKYVRNGPWLLKKAARSGIVEVWKVVVAALDAAGQHLLEKALQVTNAIGATVLTSAVLSKELILVKEVLACAKNSLTDAEVKRLLLGSSKRGTSKYQGGVLHDTARTGNIGMWAVVVDILKREGLFEEALHKTGTYGTTVVTSAVESKEPAMVKEVVECVRQNVPDQQKVIRRLLASDFTRRTVLHYAARGGNIGVWAAVVDILKREGLLEKELRATDMHKQTVVMSAVDSEEPAMVKRVDDCVRQNVPDQEKVKRLLLGSGKCQGAVLQHAARTGNIGVWAVVVDILKREGLFEEALETNGSSARTVVRSAVRSEEPAMVNEVVECVRRTAPDQQKVKSLLLHSDARFGTVLHVAAKGGKIGVWAAVVDILKREGLLEMVLDDTSSDHSVVMSAVASKKPAMVEEVVDCVRQNIPDRQKVESMLAELTEEERAKLCPPEKDEALDPGGGNAAPAEQISSSRVDDAEQDFGVQVASFAELHDLTRDNRDALEELKGLLGSPVPATSSVGFPNGAERIDADKLRELDQLVTMAKALGEMVSRYSEKEGLHQKEIALEPGVKAYYGAIRTGLCNAYVAASVVDSGVVSSSKVGAMGKAGATLKLISGAVPVFGGLAGLAGAALQAGDCCIQTRRILKMMELAPDARECSKLARTLALSLTDGLTDGAIASSHRAKEDRKHGATRVDWGTGGSTSNPGSSGVDEDAVIEWFVEEISNCEPPNFTAVIEVREVKAGKRLGRRHLNKLLTAVGQDCLQGTNTTAEKVDRLLKVIPEAIPRPAAIVSTPDPEISFSRSPVPALSHDGGVDRGLEFAALQAKLEALELADAKRQAEFEALKSDKEKLLNKVVSMEKRIPKPHAESEDSVDAGGGLLFAQERRTKTKTKEEFDQEMENPARATDRQSATADDVRVTRAHVEELGRETGHLGARISALEENKGKKRGLQFLWRGKR